MQPIYQSASKIVFILLALTTCAGFLTGRLDTKDFMVLASMAFTFYFANKGETNSVEMSAGSSLPFAGK